LQLPSHLPSTSILENSGSFNSQRSNNSRNSKNSESGTSIDIASRRDNSRDLSSLGAAGSVVNYRISTSFLPCGVCVLCPQTTDMMVLTCSGIAVLRVLYARDIGGNREEKRPAAVSMSSQADGQFVSGKKLSTDQYTVIDVVVPEPSPRMPFSPVNGAYSSPTNSPSNYDDGADGLGYFFHGNVVQRVELPQTPFECSKIEVLVLKRRHEHVCVFDLQAFARDLRSSALSTPIAKTRGERGAHLQGATREVTNIRQAKPKKHK